MLAELQKMDADLDDADVSSSMSSVTNEAKTGIRAQAISAPRLGGISKLASYLVGSGSWHDQARKTAKQREKMKKPGTTGEHPEDFNLISEQDKAAATSSSQQSAISNTTSSDLRSRLGEKAKKSPSNTSDETDESAVVVKHP